MSIDIFVDGAVSGNGTESSVGASSIYIPSLSLEYAKAFPSVTNNEVEYKAVIGAAALAIKNGWKSIIIYSDSKLVVEQVKGAYRVRQEHLMPLCNRAKELLGQVPDWKLVHIPGHGKCSDAVLRAGNDRADELAVACKLEAMKS